MQIKAYTAVPFAEVPRQKLLAMRNTAAFQFGATDGRQSVSTAPVKRSGNALKVAAVVLPAIFAAILLPKNTVSNGKQSPMADPMLAAHIYDPEDHAIRQDLFERAKSFVDSVDAQTQDVPVNDAKAFHQYVEKMQETALSKADAKAWRISETRPLTNGARKFNKDVAADRELAGEGAFEGSDEILAQILKDLADVSGPLDPALLKKMGIYVNNRFRDHRRAVAETKEPYSMLHASVPGGILSKYMGNLPSDVNPRLTFVKILRMNQGLLNILDTLNTNKQSQ